VAVAAVLSAGCYRHGRIEPDQLPELSGARTGESVLIERRPDAEGAPGSNQQAGMAGSRYRSIRLDKVVITLVDGRRLKLEAPFFIRVWRSPEVTIITVQDAAGIQSYDLYEIASVEYATFDAARPAAIITAGVVGAALGFALDAVLASKNEGPADDNDSLPGLFMFTGLALGLAVSFPLTSDL
jgi:hypothetical protein